MNVSLLSTEPACSRGDATRLRLSVTPDWYGHVLGRYRVAESEDVRQRLEQ